MIYTKFVYDRGGISSLGTYLISILINLLPRYPPRSGNYFSTHFIMGGEKFDSPQPESFLFGENSDLNYLGYKPVPFPYPPPQVLKIKYHQFCMILGLHDIQSHKKSFMHKNYISSDFNYNYYLPLVILNLKRIRYKR